MKLDLEYKAKFTLFCNGDTYQITYMCAMCDFHHMTEMIYAKSESDARLLTEDEARRSFNGCHKCGRWVCDEHYNMAEMMCVCCAAKERNKNKP